MRKNDLLQESILIWKFLLLYKGKNKKLFSFPLMLKKFSLNKEKIVKNVFFF